MATGRTISASFLTEFDEKVILLCEKISNCIENAITDRTQKKAFRDNYGKISYTRDGGAGRGAGKLQRDALCTRGVQGKAPYSNRNLRWHPLVIATEEHEYAVPIERIEIEEETLFFVVKINNREKVFPADKVHELPQRFVTLPKHWEEHIETLRYWGDTQWTQNSCIITAYEACDWRAAVETYAVLGLSVAVDDFRLDFDNIYNAVVKILQDQQVDSNIQLPSPLFPTDKDDIICCPLCRVPKSQNPANIEPRQRENRFKFAYSGNKRGEGDDSSMQIMHINPLVESELRHNAANVRFGHRWCNVAMTDHSIEETVDFME